MKRNTGQIERTLHQWGGEALPADHPMMAQLERLYGAYVLSR